MAVPTNISIVDLVAHSRRMLIVEAEVTGTATVSTGLVEVEHVIPWLEEDSAATGTTVSAETATQATYPGRITLKVWQPTNSSTTTPTASSTAKTVKALVIGTGVVDH